ncbi:hypothetical protein FQN55_009172 [Onygenales sp. PD_40]|nr:hypothetical protein FQN55_009172 [Onygenales sp. PD_40]KAK2800790.1 hypothetical protein FQN51_005930 [Onygenales sp. PD_10]
MMPPLSDEEYLFIVVMKLCTKLGWKDLGPLYYETFPNAYKNKQPVGLYFGLRHAATKFNRFDKVRRDVKAGRELALADDQLSRQFLTLVKMGDLSETGIAFSQAVRPANPEN